MKNFLLLFLIVTSINYYSFGQILYEKGYYIDSSDNKIDCFIKNLDWNNNPTQFTYTLTEKGEKKTLNIKDVKEFSVGESLKYIRVKIKIDISNSSLTELSNNSQPIFEERELFLQVLIEGKANLYFYKNNKLIKFFYSKQGLPIEQLIFKKYIIDGNKVRENKQYIHQIFNNLKCSNFTIQKINQIKYIKKDFINLFSEYNLCESSNNVDYSKRLNRDFLNISITPRFIQNFITLDNKIIPQLSTNIQSKSSFGIGIESEYILPFRKNKWSIFLEPSFQISNFEKQIKLGNSNQQINYQINYKFIQIPFGLRHYFFLNPNSKLFLNGAFLLNFNINSTGGVNMLQNNILIDKNELYISKGYNYNSYSFSFGFGYKFENRYSLEFRYTTQRNILDNVFWEGLHNNMSFIFGYSFLRLKK